MKTNPQKEFLTCHRGVMFSLEAEGAKAYIHRCLQTSYKIVKHLREVVSTSLHPQILLKILFPQLCQELNGTFVTQHDTPKHITLVGKNWRKVSKKKHAWREAKIKQKN